MQVDGALQITPCCSLVALGGEKEVNRVTCLVHSTLQVFPLTIDFDIGEAAYQRAHTSMTSKR